MATGTQIVAWVKEKYPKANNILDATFISDLHDIHTELFIKLRKLKSYYLTDTAITTVASQLEYTLPTNCSLPDIIILEVENSNSEYEKYNLADAETNIDSGNFYSYGSAENKFILTKDGVAIDTTGLKVKISYYPNPTAITALAQTPELDVKYHTLLKYKLLQRTASTGDNPDPEIANYWEQEFSEYYDYVERDLNLRRKTTTTTPKTIIDIYGV